MSNISNLAEAREARRLQQPHQSSGKGYALLHRKIMDVPFYKDSKLAATLSKLEIGDMIPPELYEVVAEILVFVDKMDRLKDKLGK